MDRYLSKPFTIEQLYCILESCVPHSADDGSAAAGAGPVVDAGAADRGEDVADRGEDVADRGEDVADRAAAAREPDAAVLDERTLDRIRDLHRRGGPNLLGKMAELYLSSSRALIDDARGALASGDASGVAQALHALKSSSGSIGATLLADLCERLESAGRHSVLDGAESQFEAVMAEHARVVRALDALSAAA